MWTLVILLGLLVATCGAVIAYRKWVGAAHEVQELQLQVSHLQEVLRCRTVRRLANWVDPEINRERQGRGLPPVRENASYLWVAVSLEQGSTFLALTDADWKRARDRAKKNAVDLCDPQLLPLEVD